MSMNWKFFPYMAITLLISSIYFKLFIFGKIPFPGDLLVTSYSPWLDYNKFPVQNPLISDVFSQFFLWKQLAIESFKNWQWPLWNPYSFTGTPLLATYHSAVLYPLNAILLLPKYFGWGIFIYSQTLIAAITFYLFISRLAKSKTAGVIGAIIYSLGGLMTTWLELGTAGHAMAWLPLSFFAIELYLESKKIRYLFILSFSLTLIILSGNVQITTYAFVLITAFLVVKTYNKNRANFVINLFPLLIALFTAVSLSSMQLLPSLDLLQKSIRLTDSYTNSFNYGLLPVGDSLKFIIADFFGNPVTRNYWGFLNYSETSGFIGTATLPLLLFAVIYLRKNKISIFFLAVFFLSLLLSFQNPLSILIYQIKIPILTSSYASRMLFITLFSVSILSSLSINQFQKNNQEIKIIKALRWSLAALAGIILGAIFAYFFVYKSTQSILLNAPSEYFRNLYSITPNYILSDLRVSLRNSVFPIAIMVILFISAFVIKKLSPKKFLLILPFVFIVLLTLDLGRYFLKFNPFVNQNLIFPNTPSLQFLKNQPGLFRVGREHAEVFPPNTWIAYNLYSIEGYDPLYLDEYAKFMRFLNGGDIRLVTTGRYAEIASNYKSPYLDAANVKYYMAVLRDRKGQIPGDLLDYRLKETGYKPFFKDKSSEILENPDAKERVYFAKKVTVASNKEIEDEFMDDKNFDPRSEILLSKSLQITSVTGEGKAEITYYSPNIVKIKTETSNDEVLILADQFEDGWNATLDGKNIDISRANLIFRAVKVPSGSHEIIFNYWPKSFDTGLKISSIGILLIIFAFIITVRIRRF